jgi:glycosyltransferase involved in cell wall biosynthesis
MRKKILLKGPLLTRSGYGEQSRFALRSLRSREDLFDIYIQPLQWGHTSWLNIESDERSWIDNTIEKTIGYIQQGGQFDIALQVTIPNEWEALAPINVGYTAGIETTKVAPQWIEKGNLVDKIIVVSTHSKQVYENTSYEAVNEQTEQKVEFTLNKTIDVVNYPVKLYDELPALDLELDYDFNFLAVAQFGPRKNIPNTIKWFVEEFKDEEVGLVVKSNIAKNCLMDREQLFADMRGFMSQLGEHKCKVYLLHGDMTDEEMHSLYRHPKIDALVALPHGEGFGLPIFEAAYSGLPVVATGWSGQLDFLVDEKNQEHFYNVSFDIQPVQENVVWDGVIVQDSMWAYAREQSAKEKMRECYENREDGNASAEYAQELHERFSEEKMYAKFVEALSPPTEEEANVIDIL